MRYDIKNVVYVSYMHNVRYNISYIDIIISIILYKPIRYWVMRGEMKGQDENLKIEIGF